jgi:hypothetical protein
MTGPNLSSRIVGFWIVLFGASLSNAARAQAVATEPEAAAAEPEIEQARALYLEGLRLVKLAQWSEALAAFERSSELRPHAMTIYNIGACERALGRYTRARQRFQDALHRDRESSELPPSIVTEAGGFIAEINRLLVRITLQIEPAGAGLVVDGRPLVASSETAARASFVAGIRAPGPGTPAPRGAFEVVVDPGPHVITLSRKGYSDVVVNRSFVPGQRVSLRLELERLPATIRVASNQRDALVSINGKDMGPVPLDVLRPAGAYRIEVSKPDFMRYRADVRVNPGQETIIRASLVREQPSIVEKWWFWTAAGVLVSGVAVSTYFLTRSEPEPERPPLDGGNLGWVAPISR